MWPITSPRYRSPLSFLKRTRVPHQPGCSLGTQLCPNMVSLETSTFSLSGAWWRFRFPILFRDRSLLHTTQCAFLLYPTTCLALHSISHLLHRLSAFCRCSPTSFRVHVDHVLVRKDVSLLLKSEGWFSRVRLACKAALSHRWMGGCPMGRKTLASLPHTWDQSLQLLPAAGRSGNTLSPRGDAYQIHREGGVGEQEGRHSRLRQSQQNVSVPFYQGPSSIIVALCRCGSLPSAFGMAWQPMSITMPSSDTPPSSQFSLFIILEGQDAGLHFLF